MVRKLTALAVAMFVLSTASWALCADVVGTVSDVQGNPVQGVQITVQTPAGNVVAKAVTSTNGKYQIVGLNPGTYDCSLNPQHTGFKAGTAVSYLDPKGLTLNWKVSTVASAIALASPGTTEAVAGDPFGFSPAAFAALVIGSTAAIAGGVVGGYGAAGGFSSNSHAASPAL